MYKHNSLHIDIENQVKENIHMEKKFCPSCGRETKKETKFCEGCGHSFEMNQGSNDSTSHSQTINANHPLVKPVSILIVLIIGLFGLYYFVFSGHTLQGEWMGDEYYFGDGTTIRLDIDRNGNQTISVHEIDSLIEFEMALEELSENRYVMSDFLSMTGEIDMGYTGSMPTEQEMNEFMAEMPPGADVEWDGTMVNFAFSEIPYGSSYEMIQEFDEIRDYFIIEYHEHNDRLIWRDREFPSDYVEFYRQ